MHLGTRIHPSQNATDRHWPTLHLQRTIKASGWMYSSRALVFVWALTLTHTFGVGSYGLYAMAFSAGALIGVPLDGYFSTRGPRVTREVFLRERTTRMIFGFALCLVGVVAWPFSFLAGFAVLKAGSDVAFQASRSQLIRSGQPDRAQRADAIRQVIGMACGTSYLLLADAPHLQLAAALYLGGAALPIALGLQAITHARPSLPEINTRSAVILAESVFAVAYVHAEVLLLGAVSPAAAGYYSIGTTLVWSLAALGQSFGTTYHDSLRASRGDVSAGPQLRTAVLLSASTAAVLVGVAITLWWIGAGTELWLTYALLVPVSFLRTLSSVATVVLVLQHRDRFRLLVTLVALAVKVGLLLTLRDLGGPGAATAFIVADIVMSGSYAFAVYGRRGRRSTAA